MHPNIFGTLLIFATAEADDFEIGFVSIRMNNSTRESHGRSVEPPRRSD